MYQGFNMMEVASWKWGNTIFSMNLLNRDTPMTPKLNDAQRDALTGKIPLGRMGVAADVAAAVTYLAANEAGWVTGSTMHVNGGMAML
jgi:NAD(P)-dependent dehydrogenase (short-subunit alcohol dehydrogenase family)